MLLPGPSVGRGHSGFLRLGALVGGSGRWLPALGTGQCLAVGPARHPAATKDSSEDASRQAPGTQETRTAPVHCLPGSQGARRPAAETELPLSDCGFRPARGPWDVTPDEEEEEEALTQDPFTTSTLGPGRPSACTRASGCAGGR